MKLSANSLLTVINDILDFSRIEAGKLQLEPVDFNIRENLADTMKGLALRAHQKNLELACDIEPTVPEMLAGDPGRLRQIIVNLVGNAIKFTEQGDIVVQARVESQTKEQVCLHFTVADTGIGIPAEKHQAIFSAFEQVDGSSTRKYGGTGLGLAISSRLVHTLGGRIWVESKVGEGSTFHFTMYFGVADGVAVQPMPPCYEKLHGLPVLVVDDNCVNRQILAKMLNNWQMKPTTADGGRAALTALEQARQMGEPFPLVLLDARMPEMDGFMLAERIRATPEFAGATIMMLTFRQRDG